MPTVSELNVYPFKSARGIALAAAKLAPTGFEWDRHWMAVDPHGVFVSQRTHPGLARVIPELSDDALILHAPGLEPLALPLRAQGERVPVRVWKDRCTGLDQGDAAGAWISRAAGGTLRVVRLLPETDRGADPAYAGPQRVPMSFADGFPILVCNRASLEALNERMPEPIPMNRFRPNVVLDGLPPFAEDRIATISVGEIVLRLVKPSTRCVITSTDQDSGERSTDPLPVLRSFRFDRALKGVTFGENAVVAAGTGQTLTRGAACAVTYEP